MGKKIVIVSRWSLRSIVSFYGKAMTLFFALGSVFFGFTVKSASADSSGVNTNVLKGKALFSSDSTVLKNVKLYLCNAFAPVYGMSGPSYVKIDSVTSDATGNFTIEIPSQITEVVIMTGELTHDSKKSQFVSNGIYYPKEKDTTFTFYLKPISTAILSNTDKHTANHIQINQGKTLSIKFSEKTESVKSARVVSITGEVIASLNSSPDGCIAWNTESVAKGIYLLNITDGLNKSSMKITVK